MPYIYIFIVLFNGIAWLSVAAFAYWVGWTFYVLYKDGKLT